MNETLEQILGDDFLWNAIVSNVAGRRKLSRKGFLNIDCPMCVSMGETPDHRGRCGIKQNHPGLGINCYNCGFKTKWTPGDLLNRKLKDFFLMVGVSDYEVSKLNYKCFMYRNSIRDMPPEIALTLGRDVFNPTFEPTFLPKGSDTFAAWAEKGCTDPNFIEAASYMYSRGNHIAEAMDYYWTPEQGKHNLNERVIIPFKRHGMIVGYTARTFKPDSPLRRYIKESPENYLFNCDVMEKHERKYIIIIEGVLDAVAIDGVGMLGASLNTIQTAWIKSYGKQVILLPDRDKKGQDSIDIALKNDWHVSFPSLRSGTAIRNFWDDDIKDAAAAVSRHGRLWTIHSIIESATDRKLEINVKRGLML